MLAPWMIKKLRDAERDQARQDHESWSRQPSVEVGDDRRPPSPTTPERAEGGIVTVDFTLDFSL